MATPTLIADNEIAAHKPRQFLREVPKAERNQSFEADPQKYSNRIVFKSRGRILFLPVSEILWITAEENYVRICTGNATHLLRDTMNAMEQRLDPQSFLRVHRSAIVNLNYVKEVRTESHGDFMVHLVNGHKLAMSRGYRARLGHLLNRT